MTPEPAAIPYQICPLCNGQGNAIVIGFNLNDPCPVCKGERIIPMYVPVASPDAPGSTIDPFPCKGLDWERKFT